MIWELTFLISFFFFRPDGQGENKPLTGDIPLSVTLIKDGVQTSQPCRIIETVSIASQTDPVRILTPVLPSKSLEVIDNYLSLLIKSTDLKFTKD